jgi:hypothetical protein
MKKYPTSGNNNLCLMHAIFGDAIDEKEQIFCTDAAKKLTECKLFAIKQIESITQIPGPKFVDFVNDKHWDDIMTYLSEKNADWNVNSEKKGIDGINDDQYKFLMNHPNVIDFSRGNIRDQVGNYIEFSDQDFKKLNESEKNLKIKETELQIKQYKQYKPEEIIKNVLKQAVNNINSEKIGSEQPYIPLGRFIAKHNNLNLKITRDNGTGEDSLYPYHKEDEERVVAISYDGFSHFSKWMEEEDYEKLLKTKISSNEIDSVFDKHDFLSLDKLIDSKSEITVESYEDIFSEKISARTIFLNPDHPLVVDQSISDEQLKDFFKSNTENPLINAVAQVYNKITKKQQDSLLLLDQEVNALTEWAKDIFLQLKQKKEDDNKFYKMIEACGLRLIELNDPKTSGSTEDKRADTLFSMKFYITYLVKCAEIKEKIKGNDKTENKKFIEALQNNFNAVFSIDLTVCPGGIGSAFLSALSSGVGSKIIEEYATKMVKYIPPGMETHLRPFIVNMMGRQVGDTHKDSIHMYFTKKELERLITDINYCNFFNLLVQDVISIWDQIKLSSACDYLKLLNALTEDHYLFVGKNAVLDAYCLINSDTEGPFKTEKEVRVAVATQFMDKKFFVKGADQKRVQLQEVLTHLIVSSYKSPGLFFYSQALEVDILTDEGIVNEKVLTELINSSNGSARFKAFAKEQLTVKTKEIIEDKTLQRLVSYVGKESEDPKKLPDLTSELLQELIINRIPCQQLKKLLKVNQNKVLLKFKFLGLNSHPENSEILTYLIAEGIQLDESDLPNFNLLVKNRDFDFLDTLLELFPAYFSQIEFFNLNVETDYLTQKLDFMLWLGIKIENAKYTESKKDLIKLITSNADFIYSYLCIVRSYISQLEIDVFKLLVKHANSQELLLFFNNNNNNNSEKLYPLSLLTLKDPRQLVETIKLLAVKLRVEDIKTLLEKDDDRELTPLNILILKHQEHFLKTIEFITNLLEENTVKELLQKKNNNELTLFLFLAWHSPIQFHQTIKFLSEKISSKNLIALLMKLTKNKATPLHYLATNNPQHFLETIKYLTKLLPKEDLIILLKREDNIRNTPLHNLASNRPEQFLNFIQFLINEYTVLSKEELVRLLDNGYRYQNTFLHFLTAKGPEQLLKVIQLLINEDKGLGKEALKEMLMIANSVGKTFLHYLPASINPSLLFDINKFLLNKLGKIAFKELLMKPSFKGETLLKILSERKLIQDLGIDKFLKLIQSMIDDDNKK